MVTVGRRLIVIIHIFVTSVLLLLTIISRFGLTRWVPVKESFQNTYPIPQNNIAGKMMLLQPYSNVSNNVTQEIYPHMHLVQAKHSKQTREIAHQELAQNLTGEPIHSLDTDYIDVSEHIHDLPSDIIAPMLHDRTFASDEEGRLIRDLFRNYNKLIRPVKNKTDHINVAFGLSLIQLINVKWNDFQLVWTPQDYGNIKTIRIPYSRIWTPDIVLFNNADGKYEVSTKCNVVLNFDGGVLWVPPSIYKSSCTIDVEYFPFDEQHCIMRFGSWTFNGDEVGFSFFDDREFIDLNDFSVSGTWDVINVPAFLNVDNRTRPTVTDVSFHMYIRRKTLFYTVNLLAPCIMMSFLSVLVFYLPPDGNEKITLGISILLAIVLFQLVVSKLLPPTSLTIPLIAKYLLFTFVMNLICVLFTVIIVNWNFRAAKTHHLPRWLKTLFIEILPKFIFMRRPVLIRPSKSASYSFEEDDGDGDWAHSKSTVLPPTPATCGDMRFPGSRDFSRFNLTTPSDTNARLGATLKNSASCRNNILSHHNVEQTTGFGETHFFSEESKYHQVPSGPLSTDKVCSAALPLTQGANIVRSGDFQTPGNNISVIKAMQTPPSAISYPHAINYNHAADPIIEVGQVTMKKASKPSIKRCISKTSLLKTRDNSLELSEFHKNLNNYRFASTSNPNDLNADLDPNNSHDTSIDQDSAFNPCALNGNYNKSPSHFLTEKDLREIEELARLEHDITNFGYPSNGSSENSANLNGKNESLTETHTDSCLSDKEFVSQIPNTPLPKQNANRQVLASSKVLKTKKPVANTRKPTSYDTSRTSTIVRQDSIDLGTGEELGLYQKDNAVLDSKKTNIASTSYGTDMRNVLVNTHSNYTIPHGANTKCRAGSQHPYLNQNLNNNNSNERKLSNANPTNTGGHQGRSRDQRPNTVHPNTSLNATTTAEDSITHTSSHRPLPSRSHSNDAILAQTHVTTPNRHLIGERVAEKRKIRKKHFPHIPTRVVKGAAKDVIFVARHLKQEDENNMEREDWKYIAIVIDRILLYIFIIVTLGGTLGIITSAPHIFEYVDQQERIQFLTGQKTA